MERAEAMRRLAGHGFTRWQIAARLFMAYRDVPDPATLTTAATVVTLPARRPAAPALAA